MNSHETLENAAGAVPAGWGTARRPLADAAAQASPGLAPAPNHEHGHDCGGGDGHGCGHGAAHGGGHGDSAGPDDPAKGGRARPGEPPEPDLPAAHERSAPLIEHPRPIEAASVDGVPLQAEGEAPDSDTLRQRACTELLRQAAQRAGLLAGSDQPSWDRDGGVVSEAASAAIEALLERELVVPEPSEEACRRHHAARAAVYSTGERVRARHILFAVTPGTDVGALRRQAEAALLDVRARDHREPSPDDDVFARAARNFSNCPSGQHGGDLGWLERADCAPEFARELFGHAEVGVLPRLVHSRFGLHVVEVLERSAGDPLPFEQVAEAVALSLRQQSYVTALRQYLSLLAGAADLRGVDLEAADSPLVR